MTSEARARRIGDRMAEELAEILQRDTADPRLAGLTVTGVDVDRELAYATVHVTASMGTGQPEDILAALRQARGFLRSELARRIALRTFPDLRFRWDASAERGARIEQILESLKKEQGGRPGKKV